MHRAADALFNLPTTGVEKTELEDEVPVIVVTETSSHQEKPKYFVHN